VKRTYLIGIRTLRLGRSANHFAPIFCIRQVIECYVGRPDEEFCRPCENSMPDSVSSRGERILAVFPALRGHRPRNLSSASCVAEFSHGLFDLCTA
jgi:hypothetical protein